MSKLNNRIENAVQIGVMLAARQAAINPPMPGWNDPPTNFYAGQVATLQKSARALHRMAERACCEDLGCRKCGGTGASDAEFNVGQECRSCAGTGLNTGRSRDRILSRVRSIADGYRLRVYHQSDPRGCPLYLIPQESGPASDDDAYYNMRGVPVVGL